MARNGDWRYTGQGCASGLGEVRCALTGNGGQASPGAMGEPVSERSAEWRRWYRLTVEALAPYPEAMGALAEAIAAAQQQGQVAGGERYGADAEEER